MSTSDIRQHIQRVAKSAKALITRWSNELIVYWNKETLGARLGRICAILEPYVQSAKKFLGRLGEAVVCYVTKRTLLQNFRSGCIALVSLCMIGGMGDFLLGTQRSAVVDGRSSRFFSDAQSNFLNKWASFEERALRGFPETRNGDLERQEFQKEYEKMRMARELVFGWRCYVTYLQDVDLNGFECSFANRESHCSSPNSPCLYRMTYASDESRRRLGPISVLVRPLQRRKSDGGFAPVDVGLGSNRVYVGDVVEFDGKISGALSVGSFSVDASRIVVIAKETFTREQYKDVKPSLPEKLEQWWDASSS